MIAIWSTPVVGLRAFQAASAAFTVAVVLAQTPPVSAAPVLEEIDSQLQQAAENLGAVIVRWSARRSFLNDAEDRTDLPGYMHSPAFVRPFDTELWCDHQRFRIRQEKPVGLKNPDGKTYTGSVHKSVSDYAFDGEVTESGIRDLDGTVRRQFPEEFLRDNPEAQLLDADYWDASGWKAPCSFRDMHTDSDSLLLTPWILQFGRQGAERKVLEAVSDVDGHECYTVTITHAGGVYECQVDPTINYAIRSWRRLSPQGELLEVGHLSEFRSFGTEKVVWLPEKCRCDYFQFDHWPAAPSKAVLRVDYSLLDLQVVDRVADEQISLVRGEYRHPGAEIADSTHPAAKSLPDGFLVYVIPADMNDLDRTIAAAAERLPPHSTNSRRMLLLLILNGIVIMVIVGMIWHRRSRAR